MNTAKSRVYDRLAFWGTCLGYLLFFVFLLASFSGKKAMHNRYVNRKVASTIYQVKWNLYTNPPFDSVYRLYTIHDHRAELYDVRPFAPRFLYGLRRDSKIITEELTIIMMDTLFMNRAVKYHIVIPEGGDINSYIKQDTLQFNTVYSRNVRYLKGKYLITSEPPLTWEQARSGTVKNKVLTVMAVNITDRNE